MAAYFSPLDTDYLRLGQAAALLARERGQCTPADIMDLFKRALFEGELDAPPFEIGETRNDPSNWLHMEIEAPRCTLPPSQAGLKPRPKELYGVNRGTVASVLLTTDALPGDRADWERVFDVGEPDYRQENAFSALVAIPFRDFPEHGRQELEAIITPKAKLALWFAKRGLPQPMFLLRATAKQRASDTDADLKSPGAEMEARDARRSGRPQKPAWPRIAQLVRQLAGEHPDWQKKQLAFEAWSLARAEFAEDELPSVATIQRSMVEILDGGSG